MKKFLSILMAFIFIIFTFILPSCSSANNNQTQEETFQNTLSTSSEEQNTQTEGKKVLIVYFSRADENYSVGVIEKGNTEIVADIISDNVGGTLFHVERVTPYPSAYRACTDEAKQEQNNNARPEIIGDINIEDYDIIFLGYPIWWSDLPMAMYTFIEKHNWNGKIVCPFVTHEGSGLAGTVTKLKNKLTGATVKDGLAIRGSTAQNNRDETSKLVKTWLSELNIDY